MAARSGSSGPSFNTSGVPKGRSSDDLQQFLILALANTAGDMKESRLMDRLNAIMEAFQTRVDVQIAEYQAQLDAGADPEHLFDRARQVGVANYWDMERARLAADPDAYAGAAGAVRLSSERGELALERREYARAELDALRSDTSATPGSGLQVHHLDSVKGADPGSSAEEQLRRALDPSQMIAATPEAHLRVLHGGNTQLPTHSFAAPGEASNEDMAEHAGDSVEFGVGMGLSVAMVGINGLWAGSRRGGRAALLEMSRTGVGAGAGLVGALGTAALVGTFRRTSTERLSIDEQDGAMVAVDLGEWTGQVSPALIPHEWQDSLDDLFGDALGNLDMIGGRVAWQFASAFLSGGSWDERLRRGAAASVQGTVDYMTWTGAELGTEFVMEAIKEGATELGISLVADAAGAAATFGVSLIFTGARLAWKAYRTNEIYVAGKAVQALTWQHQVERARKVVSEL